VEVDVSITANELKAFLNIGDTVDDSLLIGAVAATDQWVTEYCGRSFTTVETPTAKTFRPTDAYVLVVKDFWTLTGLVVKTDDDDDGTFETTWVIGTDFTVDVDDDRPYGELVAVGSRTFPVGHRWRRSVEVTAAWGWAEMPGPVKQASLIQAARIFKRKDSPAGVLGGFADFTALRVSSRIDPDVADMLQPFRHPDIAVHVA